MSQEIYDRIVQGRSQRNEAILAWGEAKESYGDEHFCVVEKEGVSLLARLSASPRIAGQGYLEIDLDENNIAGKKNRKQFKDPDNAESTYKELGLKFNEDYSEIHCDTRRSSPASLWGLSMSVMLDWAGKEEWRIEMAGRLKGNELAWALASYFEQNLGFKIKPSTSKEYYK